MRITPERALLSVSDKTGIEPLANALASYGVELLSTGGTATQLAQAGCSVEDVSDYTGVPEMMDGRVKTLVPKVHGGLLAVRDHPSHQEAMQAHDIPPIDLLIVNLYPFELTVARGGSPEEVIEQIDIGGPAMVRSAAKNHRFVTVMTDPADYEALLAEMKAQDGGISLAFRQRMAAKAFGRTAAYDTAISQWFAQQHGVTFPDRLLGAERKAVLRYGENPHQQAAYYVSDAEVPGVANATQLQGKELSYNNIQDTEAAFELVAEFDQPAAAIIKHANPCGVAVADTLSDAYRKALASDPVSAFGGIIALNRALDEATATQIVELFAEVVIAPAIDEAARAVLAAKKNLRLLATGGMPARERQALQVKSIAGGYLVQTRDNAGLDASQLTTVTSAAPSESQLADLCFAFTVCKHVKSNAIVLAKDGATMGIGGGQTSRVDAVRQSIHRANTLAGDTRRSDGAVLASDAFFPFPDNIELAAEAGIRAIIQPGGSVKDEEVIRAADAAGMAMVFTGQRHFRH